MPSDTDRQGGTQAHAVEGVAKLSPRELHALKSRSMATVEGLVVAATEGGRDGFCELLDVAPSALNGLLQDARKFIGEERFRVLKEHKPGGRTEARWHTDPQTALAFARKLAPYGLVFCTRDGWLRKEDLCLR